MALPLAAVSLGASAFEMGALRAAQWLSFLLLALPAGLWVERWRKRPVLVFSNLGQAALFSLVPLLAYSGVLGVGHLVAVAFAAGACALLFELAYHSYLPRLVGREVLVEANGKLMASMSVSEVGGPGLGGALVGLLTAPFAFLFDALSFLFAAAALWRITRPEPNPPPGNKSKEAPEVWRTNSWRASVLRGAIGTSWPSRERRLPTTSFGAPWRPYSYHRR